MTPSPRPPGTYGSHKSDTSVSDRGKDPLGAECGDGQNEDVRAQETGGDAEDGRDGGRVGQQRHYRLRQQEKGDESSCRALPGLTGVPDVALLLESSCDEEGEDCDCRDEIQAHRHQSVKLPFGGRIYLFRSLTVGSKWYRSDFCLIVPPKPRLAGDQPTRLQKLIVVPRCSSEENLSCTYVVKQGF